MCFIVGGKNRDLSFWLNVGAAEKYKAIPIELVNGYPSLCIKSGLPTQPAICKRCNRDCKFAGGRGKYNKLKRSNA